MKKILLLTTVLAMLAFSGYSQSDKFWSPNLESRLNLIPDKAVSRQSYPKEVKLFNLNFTSFQKELFTVVGKQASKSSTIISLPNADGNLEQFEIFEASNFEPELQARFPEIRAYSGNGITDKYATLKLSVSPQGIQTMVFRLEKDNEFMEPYSKDHAVYAVYRSHREKGMLPWSCSTEDKKMAAEIKSQVQKTQSSAGQLKTMRLAQSVTAEYSNYFGATSSAQVSLVLAAINATLTRCNGVYEKDLALHLNLIANTTSVIYYNAATDPYSAAGTGAGGAWNSQLQSTLTSVIGEANYDIGHLFGASGGGGNAGCIGCVCTNGSKGSGFTSPADAIPQGDNFDIDYVVHEVGHQLGANHTFTMSSEGGSLATSVQKEVGSGITIMGYAGITSQDVAPHSIAIYHAASIAQIQTNLASKTCPVTTNISANNATPVANAGLNYTIPISTPFALTGSATDANAGDVLTYCWEQNDATTTLTGASSVASATKAAGPNWLSFAPSSSPIRLCPRLSTILAGGVITGPLAGGDAGANIEALSSVSRTLNFRLTVRDNSTYRSTAPIKVGQTNFDDMVVTVSNTSGPFAVTSPNTAVSYPGGSTQTVTWSVNNTTAAPVSCANVKISLSTDGGNTFPTVLAASTPNDGSQLVTLPNIATTTARIKVEAVGNIFFDISNANFTITVITCAVPTNLSATTTTSSATLSWAAASGAVTYGIDYKLATSFTWISAATTNPTTSITINGLAAGSLYDFRVRTNCALGISTTYSTSQFTTKYPALTAIASNDGPLCPGNTLNLSVNPAGGLAPYTYLWSGPGGFTSTLKTPSIPNVTSANAGLYSVTVKDNQGVPFSIIASTTLIVKSTSSATNNLAICPSQLPYVWNGLSLPTAGLYSANLINSQGCDSIDMLNLSILPTSSSTTNLTICESALPYVWNDRLLPTAGTYTATLTNSVGCDSIATLILTTFAPTQVSFTALAPVYNIAAAAVTMLGSPSGGTFSGPGVSGSVFSPSVAGVGGPYTISYSIVDGNSCINSTSQQTKVANCAVTATPGVITTLGGAAAVCPGDTKTYSIAAVAGATSYTWTPPTGGNISTGQGTTTVTITYTTGFIASGTLKVVANNACGFSVARSLTITRNTALTPSVITGNTYGVCRTSGVPYSVVNVAGRTYNWTFNTSTASIATGQGTNAITANFVPGYVTGILSVTATTACGTSTPRTITIKATPAAPAAIVGVNTVCANQSGVPYSIAPVSSASTYTWTAPAGSKVSDGVTTSVGTALTTTSNAVTVNYGTTAGNLIARGNNACGAGLSKTLAIAITCKANDGKAITQEGGTKAFNIALSPNPSTNQFTLVAHSNSKQPVNVRVIDGHGKVVNVFNGQAEQTFKFGDKLMDGLYLLEVRQGENVKTIQAVKSK